MAKAQINFRIDRKLLDAIKAEAERNEVGYTQWVIKACEHCLASGFVAHGRSMSPEEVEAKIEKVLVQKTALIWQEIESLKTDQSPRELNTRALQDQSGSTPKPDSFPSSLFNGLSGAALARRLRCDAGGVSRWKKRPPKEFAAWTAKQDPEGIAWMVRGRLFFPIDID